MNKMHRKRFIIITIIVLILSGIVSWGISWEANGLQRVQELQQQVSDPSLSPEERDKKRQQIHEEIDKLSDKQRNNLREQRFADMEQRMDRVMQQYFVLPEKERIAFLDKQIQTEEKRRKEWESHRNGQQNQNLKSNQSNSLPNGRQTRTPEQRMQRRNQFLDRSTPELRAQRNAYRAAS